MNNIETLKTLIALLEPNNSDKEPSESTPSTAVKELGQNIVVLDRGFVYVGTVTDEGEWMRVRDAKNIRVWGTSEGLGELRNGPVSATKLDTVGEILFTKRALIHLVPCQGF